MSDARHLIAEAQERGARVYLRDGRVKFAYYGAVPEKLLEKLRASKIAIAEALLDANSPGLSAAIKAVARHACNYRFEGISLPGSEHQIPRGELTTVLNRVHAAGVRLSVEESRLSWWSSNLPNAPLLSDLEAAQEEIVGAFQVLGLAEGIVVVQPERKRLIALGSHSTLASTKSPIRSRAKTTKEQ
jgi:hypothetical protein